MMRILTAMLVCGLVAHASFAGAPGVTFISPGPGLNAPLDDDTDPDTYGKWQSGNGWTMDGDSASADAAVAPLAYGRYLTTLEGEESMTAMPTDQDWVLEIVQKHTGDFNAESAWFTKNWDADTRMVMLNCVGGDDWILRVGNAGGGWDVVASQLSLGNDWNTFTVHYKAADGKLDAYQNGALIAGDFQTGHGNYDINHIQFETLRMGTDWYQSIKIGQIPEPATMLLIGLAAPVLLRSRRKA